MENSTNVVYNYSDSLCKALAKPEAEVPIGDVERAISLIERNDGRVPDDGSQRPELVAGLRTNLNRYKSQPADSQDILAEMREQAQAYYATVRVTPPLSYFFNL